MTEPHEMFKSPANAKLALGIAAWLTKHDYACALIESSDGVISITYMADKGHGKVWPSILVDTGKIRFPKNSPTDLVMAFLGESGDPT